MDDDQLENCNETELLWMARAQGLGHLKRGLPKTVLISIVTGRVDPTPDHYAGSSYSRIKLESFITKYWNIVQSQLPGCNGKCTTYPCSEGRHLTCFESNRDQVQ